MSGLQITFSIALFVGGYVASIYTWTRLKVIVNGAQAEAEKLRAKAKAIVEAAQK
ncbi:hypothetical protein OCAR_5600 [Afipia carboxidovorans OM5]|uniref:Uncharacterized protein n=1 Tax=Afipia carboxidovorans (strain ATCC 49405 / DSM 1227 / KCTC 32145 / OM5) TaxID=504832 RepID=B6JEG6_AFIC5|nr:hypothetical protein [Afipia carboxidovorans]ACI92731.1 hypothetical protein OCAR_5600 [Afipia carboxidovorans OM5]AEI03517.1 hypothetical protein OCA4_c23970 [Afipia carboxidovorans OM4]AEI07094.1 hypothetical protein OCA5_c23980 [Afipia carboxidovorans OM5]